MVSLLMLQNKRFCVCLFLFSANWATKSQWLILRISFVRRHWPQSAGKVRKASTAAI